MPDNKNENKFMAMLERRGIVRKAGSDEDIQDATSGGAPSRPDEELTGLFGSYSGDAPKVTPAARQPVPGISNLNYPGERAQNPDREQRLPSDLRPAASPTSERPMAADYSPGEAQQSVDAPRQEMPMNVDTSRPASFSGNAEPRNDDSFLDVSSIADSATDMAGIPQRPQADDYTDRYLDIPELYDALAIRSKRTDTIYLVEEYINTLPDSLPDESRREIVSKIVAASGFDFDLLMGDGVLRVKMLKEYAERFAHHTDEYIAARQSELDALDQQILRVRKMIENRRELHKKQFFAIETEAQRLKDILSFITG